MGVGAGLYMCVVVVRKFTFAISSPDEFLSFYRGPSHLCLTQLSTRECYRQHSTIINSLSQNSRHSMQTCTHKQVERLSKINKANVSAPQNLLLQLSPRNFSGIFLGCQVSEWLGHICKILNVFPPWNRKRNPISFSLPFWWWEVSFPEPHAAFQGL